MTGFGVVFLGLVCLAVVSNLLHRPPGVLQEEEEEEGVDRAGTGAKDGEGKKEA